jgi:capsular exopolysaccharide synthesis family protein
MLNKASWPRVVSTAELPPGSEERTLDLFEVSRLLRRQKRLIATVLGLTIFASLAYLAIASVYYTASAMMLFEIRTSEPFQQQGFGNDTVASAFVDSQVEVLKSDDIARSVVKRLNLLSDPEFVPVPGIVGSIIGFVTRIIGAGPASTEADQLTRAARKFEANLTIKRIGLTYVASIDYRSLDPNKAARIANAVTEAYFIGQLDAKSRAARRANIWLQDRINELKSAAETTERAVADYKSKSSQVDANKRPLNEQDLTKLSSQRRVLLKDLESSAQTYRALYESLLQRVTEFTQQQSFPMTDARIVSEAVPPLEKSDPKVLLILGAATLLGLVGGIGAGFARETFDKTLRTSSQVQTVLGVDCLGILPAIISPRPLDEADPALRWMPRGAHGKGKDTEDRARIIELSNQRGRSIRRRQIPVTGQNRLIEAAGDRFRFAVDAPFSRFAETIRSLQISVEFAELNGRKKVLGVTSAQPREGKSIVASNLSAMLALAGSRVLLIDCQPRNRELTQQLAPNAKHGLMRVIANPDAVDDVIWRDQSTNLDFLPMDTPTSVGIPIGVVSTSMMQRLLAAVQDRYDYIVVDLPALAPVADVKAISILIDHFLLVIEWGRLPQSTILSALDAAPLVYEKLLGVVLNNADPAALKRLEP